ncbi:hypothetical protein PR003_g15794 [Phytophthora rubi]|uniref:Tc1-like transposase DDE domain-containing protein n=1 Tax=Phytophthora rubi TaxID=129364 RepID=A0A6A4EU83_9STRA|nr:hypothetical protein PR002_g20581 [Phytophthora rubi]KAE9328409.1 hypothetical protein PR003_g15794 [Phytophthora rubi]
MPKEPKHTLAARARVLDAHRECGDWMLVAHHNGIPPTTARNIVERGTPELKKRGGARAAITKCTPEMESALVDYLEENCQYTLSQMRDMLFCDFGVLVSTSLISRKLCGKLYTVKQVRVEPETCNNAENIEKRRVFGEALLKHEREGAFIVYYDETNYNLYCKRSQGRAPIGERAVVKLPPSKGANLQLQCAVSPEVGLVHYEKRRGSIKMDVNAGFVDSIYDAVKQHDVYKEHFVGKNIVVILDNPPVHNQTENLVRDRCDLVLLRLGQCAIPSKHLESTHQAYLALSHEEMMNVPYGQKTVLRMQLLEKAAEHAMPCMDLRLVNKMARHGALSVAAAIRSEPMEYGT